MNFKAISVFAWVLLIATAAVAGEQQRTRIEIQAEDDALGTQSFIFDSQEAGFDLNDMVVGESRLVTSESGSAANLRRTADGFEIDVNGKVIQLPDSMELAGSHDGHDIEMRIEHGDAQRVEVDKSYKIKMVGTGEDSGITIISGDEIDTPTRARIEAALAAGGHAGEVLYVDGSDMRTGGDNQLHGLHEVRIIRKEVDVTN